MRCQIHLDNESNSAAGVVVSCKIPILATRVRFPGGARSAFLFPPILREGLTNPLPLETFTTFNFYEDFYFIIHCENIRIWRGKTISKDKKASPEIVNPYVCPVGDIPDVGGRAPAHLINL